MELPQEGDGHLLEFFEVLYNILHPISVDVHMCPYVFRIHYIPCIPLMHSLSLFTKSFLFGGGTGAGPHGRRGCQGKTDE